MREYEGEERANLLRIVGIAAFYTIELINRYGLQLGILEMPPVAGVDERFHLAVSALAVVWAMVALGVWLALRNQVFPASLKYITTACDIALLTTVPVARSWIRSRVYGMAREYARRSQNAAQKES